MIRSGGTAAGVARDGKWTVAINANFFDQQYRPLGVVVSGAQLHPLQPVDWESIFYVGKRGEPRIVLPHSWPFASAVVAVQAGPRVVVDGELISVKAGVPDGGPSVQMFVDGAANVEGDKAVPAFLVAR